jgi:hypothetical protein
MDCPQSKVEFQDGNTAKLQAGQRQARAVFPQISSFRIQIVADPPPPAGKCDELRSS